MGEDVRIAYILQGYVPDRALLPNRRRSARGDEALRRQQRADVGRILGPQPTPEPISLGMLGRVWVRFTVAWPREKHIVKRGFHQGAVRWRFMPYPDGSNLNAALKGAEDALQDKIGISDSRFDLMPPVQQRDENGDGWTLIEVGVPV